MPNVESPHAKKVLFITIDQFRADLLRGNLADYAKLPNLKEFAQEAVSFAKHFSVTTPCGPSRTSLLTGLYAMNHRSVCSGTPLASHHTNIALEVRKCGLEPLLFGYTDTTPDPSTRPINDPDLRSYEQVMPGFREVVGMPFANSYSWVADLCSKGHVVSNYRSHWYPDGITGDASILEPTTYSSEDSDTAFLANETLKHLDLRHDQSWLAHLTFIRPHPPFHAPDPWNRMHNPTNIPDAVAIENIDRERQLHPAINAMFSEPQQSFIYSGFNGKLSEMSQEARQACRAIYLGLAAEVDHHLGRIFNWLKQTGLWDETLIVVTSDHGEMLGDHFMWGKQTIYDACYHVPLLIRDPNRLDRSGSTVDALVETIDIAPTILDWLGSPVPRAMDGHSLLPYLRGETSTNEREHVFFELELSHPETPSAIEKKLGLNLREANVAILRERRWKYIHFNGGLPPLLFDLENDPNETMNVAEVAEHQTELRRLSSKMIDHRMTNCFNAVTETAITSNGPIIRI